MKKTGSNFKSMIVFYHYRLLNRLLEVGFPFPFVLEFLTYAQIFLTEARQRVRQFCETVERTIPEKNIRGITMSFRKLDKATHIWIILALNKVCREKLNAHLSIQAFYLSAWLYSMELKEHLRRKEGANGSHIYGLPD